MPATVNVSIPNQIQNSLDQLITKAGVPAVLAEDVARLYQQRAGIKSYQYRPDKEQALLAENDQRWLESLQRHVTAEEAKAASIRDGELREIAQDERQSTQAPTRKPTELADEFVGRSLGALHARLRESDQLRIAALDADFVKDESDPSTIESLVAEAFASGHTDRINLVSRVAVRRLNALAGTEMQSNSQTRTAGEAYTRLLTRMKRWQEERQQATPHARRASAQQRFENAVAQAARNVQLVAGIVGLTDARTISHGINYPRA